MVEVMGTGLGRVAIVTGTAHGIGAAIAAALAADGVAAVDRHLVGLTNVARSVGVLPGDALPMQSVREHDGWHWLRSPVAGWWEPAVPVGGEVAAGDLLGTVSEICGGVLAEVRAPEAGVPLFLTTSPAVVADGLLLGLARGTGSP
jgi:predicted deacylase